MFEQLRKGRIVHVAARQSVAEANDAFHASRTKWLEIDRQLAQNGWTDIASDKTI